MFSKKFFLSIALAVLVFAGPIDAVCKQCSATTFVACLNETAYELCFNGIRSGLVAQCQGDTVCTELPEICVSRQLSPRLGCGLCNACALGYACVSQTEFEVCNSKAPIGAKPVGVKGECPPGKYCNTVSFLNSGPLCIDQCEAEPICYAAKKVPPPEEEYTEVCKGKYKGYYDNIYDPTCTQYVYCEEYNGVMNSVLYACNSGYFNEANKGCVATKPKRCL